MILDSLYRTLFRPREGPLDMEGAAFVAIFALLAMTLALPDAGRLQVSWPGALGLFVLLWAVFLAGWFWAGAAMTLLAHLWGGTGTVKGTLGAIAQACWPLLLVAPAVAAGNAGLAGLEHIAVLAIGVWVGWLLVGFVRNVHQLSWSRSLAAWLILAGTCAATGLIALTAAGVLAVILAST